MKKIVSLLLLLALFTSCNEYQKALKNEDISVKYEMGTKLYESGKYSKAIRLFEQVATTYRGKPQAEKLFYMFSQSYYKTNQFYLAGYQFESFTSSYPKSEKAEEAAFLGAKSYSKLSPTYSLDQTDTHKAIEKLQNFIDSYTSQVRTAIGDETFETAFAEGSKLSLKEAIELAREGESEFSPTLIHGSDS